MPRAPTDSAPFSAANSSRAVLTSRSARSVPWLSLASQLSSRRAAMNCMTSRLDTRSGGSDCSASARKLATTVGCERSGPILSASKLSMPSNELLVRSTSSSSSWSAMTWCVASTASIVLFTSLSILCSAAFASFTGDGHLCQDEPKRCCKSRCSVRGLRKPSAVAASRQAWNWLSGPGDDDADEAEAAATTGGVEGVACPDRLAAASSAGEKAGPD